MHGTCIFTFLCKGMRALLSEDDRAYVWSTFGVQLTADARLLMFATKDEDGNFRCKSNKRIPPDEWNEVDCYVCKRFCTNCSNRFRPIIFVFYPTAIDPAELLQPIVDLRRIPCPNPSRLAIVVLRCSVGDF